MHEPSRPRRWFAVLPCLLLLIALVGQWLGTELRSALVQLGERTWPEYAKRLRYEPEPPAAPPTEVPKPPETEVDVNELLVDEAGTKSEAEAAREAYERALRDHAELVRAYEGVLARRTSAVKAFSAIDRGVSAAVDWLDAHLTHLFAVMLGLCGVVATARRHHIALRSIISRLDDRVAQSISLVANLLLLASVAAQWRLNVLAGTGAEDELLSALWIAAFAGMALTNLVLLARPLPRDGSRTGLGRALLCAPLYSVMALIAGAYFLTAEGYVAGLAVYLQKLIQNPLLYLQVGLYVWAGMLLKRTGLASGAFDVVRPWRLSPEWMVIVVVLLAAIPTAYSGASGIFVIAAGGLIFRELRGAGARDSLARAATAMSGSMGVVLSPCLLVVIVGYLTRIPSAELFAWGRLVYLLTALLFAGVVLAARRSGERRERAPDAARTSARAARSLLPYGLVFAAVLVTCWLGLGEGLDEHSAPALLPLILLVVLAYEYSRRRSRGAQTDGSAAVDATDETSTHIGALLLLMALSACLGGVIERSELMALVPESFPSPVAAMGVLVVVLVMIGMVMDPYGAVILVQATLAKIAVDSGLDPVHFWMVVLVAFELGYLTPPVALNHLLARQVIDSEPAEEPGERRWWYRHERYLLPITVMGTALLLVAFVPLLWP